MATMEAVEVKERPILFSAPMVRAILNGRKTQTRRVVKTNTAGRAQLGGRQWHLDDPNAIRACPYGQPGDRLWVREALYIDLMPYDRGALPKSRPVELDERSIYYRADGECCDQIPECQCGEVGRPRWRPSIHMPRWASRITLEITDVRVERVQDISEGDARAEGVHGWSHLGSHGGYQGHRRADRRHAPPLRTLRTTGHPRGSRRMPRHTAGRDERLLRAWRHGGRLRAAPGRRVYPKCGGDSMDARGGARHPDQRGPMSEQLDPKEREWSEAERLFKVGPLEVRGRRRKPDDPTRKAFEDLGEAWRELGRALLDTGPGRGLTRTVEWLNRILTRSKR